MRDYSGMYASKRARLIDCAVDAHVAAPSLWEPYRDRLDSLLRLYGLKTCYQGEYMESRGHWKRMTYARRYGAS